MRAGRWPLHDAVLNDVSAPMPPSVANRCLTPRVSAVVADDGRRSVIPDDRGRPMVADHRARGPVDRRHDPGVVPAPGGPPWTADAIPTTATIISASLLIPVFMVVPFGRWCVSSGAKLATPAGVIRDGRSTGHGLRRIRAGHPSRTILSVSRRDSWCPNIPETERAAATTRSGPPPVPSLCDVRARNMSGRISFSSGTARKAPPAGRMKGRLAWNIAPAVFLGRPGRAASAATVRPLALTRSVPRAEGRGTRNPPTLTMAPRRTSGRSWCLVVPAGTTNGRRPMARDILGRIRRLERPHQGDDRCERYGRDGMRLFQCRLRDADRSYPENSRAMTEADAAELGGLWLPDRDDRYDPPTLPDDWDS